jgi:hypothetical protein
MRTKMCRTRAVVMLTPDRLKREQEKQMWRDKARAKTGAARDYAPMESKVQLERIKRRAAVDAAAWKKRRDAETRDTRTLHLTYREPKKGEL